MAGTMIAFSGKGGSGKTTMASMVLRELIRSGHKPVLAVDADPNATLGLALGVPPGETISDLRDNMGEAAQKPSEIPKDRLMDQWLAELLSEQAGFDLLTMGRPEGPKCYCYVNSLLRRYLGLLRKSYACVIVDCEAGMEYISRLTVDDVETLVLVAEATPVGLTTVHRITELADSLPIRIGRRVLALNKIGALDPAGEEDPVSLDLPPVAATVRVPFDKDLALRCARGVAFDDEAGSTARPAIQQLAQNCLGLATQAAPITQKEPVS